MRLALLADSHGFVPALEAGLAACRAAAPDLTLFLGDVLTCPYSPDPAEESLALLKDAAIPVLLGNHELLLRSFGTPAWDEAMALRAVRATRPAGRWVEHMAVGKSRLAPDTLAWLRTLPSELAFDGGKVLASHGLPGNPFLSVDGIDPREGELGPVRAAAFARPDVAAAELLVCAHNHVPLVTVRGGGLMVVRVAAACGWGAQRRQAERFGGYAIATRRGLTWEVEHRTFPWRPRDPAWTWDASVAAEPGA
jgi:diadenosine tetraphosphatase ApaH/serine/threonine PP2A family protein phosphatase